MNWVEELLCRYNLGKEYAHQRVLLLWRKLVGPQLLPLTRAERFKDGILIISVSSSTIAQELSFFEGQYVKRINELYGEELVHKIRFIPGRFEEDTPKKTVALRQTDLEEAHKLFSHLEDPQLQHSFERLYLTLRQREEVLLASGAKRCPRCGTVFTESGKICPGCRFGGIADV